MFHIWNICAVALEFVCVNSVLVHLPPKSRSTDTQFPGRAALMAFTLAQRHADRVCLTLLQRRNGVGLV